MPSLHELQAYTKEPKNPIGRVVLNSYFCSKSEEAATSFEFTINAYPKVIYHTWLWLAPLYLKCAFSCVFVQSLTLKAGSVAEMEEWIAAVMSPLQELSRVPGPPAGVGSAFVAATA